MGTSWLGLLGSVALQAGADWDCIGHLAVESPAPPGAVALGIEECCGGRWPEALTSGEFIPTVDVATGAEEDPSRERVPVTFTKEGGLYVGRGQRDLEAGAWRFEGTEAYGVEFLQKFEVDAELEVPPPPAPGLVVEEVVASHGSVEEGTSHGLAYVAFDVAFVGPSLAIEVYEVEDNERADEPLVVGASTAEDLVIGAAYDSCQGVFFVPAGATYDVRVAAYAANGVRGEWSDFERVDVPNLPSGGCGFVPGRHGAAVGWGLALGALALVGRRRFQGQRSA